LVLPASSFTRSGGTGASVADQVADDKVLEQIAGGATLVLQALHRTWPPLVTFRHRARPPGADQRPGAGGLLETPFDPALARRLINSLGCKGVRVLPRT
jgi:hypothetical protein